MLRCEPAGVLACVCLTGFAIWILIVFYTYTHSVPVQFDVPGLVLTKVVDMVCWLVNELSTCTWRICSMPFHSQPAPTSCLSLNMTVDGQYFCLCCGFVYSEWND